MVYGRAPQTKSFGEPVRVRTDGTRAEATESPHPRPNAGTAYERYKQSLHAFFNGQKPLPDHLKELLATRPGAHEHIDGLVEEEAEAPLRPLSAPAPSGKKKKDKKSVEADRKPRRLVSSGQDDVVALLDVVRRASSPREVEAAIDTFKSMGHELPLDADVLSKALGHSSEEILAEALRGLLTVVESGSLKSVQLLKTRVNNVALLAQSSEVRDLCTQLKGKLG